MKNIIGLLMIVFLSFTSKAQESQDYYILFKQDAKTSCQFTINKETGKKISLSYFQKRHRKVNITRFVLCKNIFTFEFQKNHFELIDATTLSKLQQITLDEIFQKEADSEYKKDINELFPRLFIIESYDNGEYAKYQVIWEKTL
jgi:hypothetical protein